MQWEYLVVYLKGADLEHINADADAYADADRFTEQLNKYAQAGWELVSFDWQGNNAKAAFKRQRR